MINHKRLTDFKWQSNSSVLAIIAVPFFSSQLDVSPNNKIVVRFGLLNVDETFAVEVNTRIGTLFLRPIKGKDERLFAIKNLGMSGVTAVAEIFWENGEGIKFKEILAQSIDVMEGFLCISRIADTCFHDWSSLTVYQRDDKLDRHNFVVQQLRSPKLKNPHYRSLTNLRTPTCSIPSSMRGTKEEKKNSRIFMISKLHLNGT